MQVAIKACKISVILYTHACDDMPLKQTSEFKHAIQAGHSQIWFCCTLRSLVFDVAKPRPHNLTCFMSHAFLQHSMAAGPEESLFQEARYVIMAFTIVLLSYSVYRAPRSHLYPLRAIHGQEFDTWAATLLTVLQSRDRSTTCLTYLRQLLVLTSVTKYNRR